MILSKENKKSIDLDLLVEEKISSGKISELLMIVPTNRKSRNLKKEFISASPGRSASGIKIETIGTLSSKLLKEKQPFVNLSEAASIVFIRQSVNEANLRYFSVYKDEIPFGTLDRIKNVISEYKQNGINFNDLRKEAEKLERSEKLKALDIADIYENYSAKCGKLNAFEIGDIYKLVSLIEKPEFEKLFLKLFPEVNLIITSGFDEFSLPEIKILNKLAENSSHRLFIYFDYYEKNKFLFSHLDKMYVRLAELGFYKIDDKSSSGVNNFHKIIRENLFRFSSAQQKHNYKKSIVKLSAYDRENEIEIISREIKELIISNNIEPDKICVAFNRVQIYSSIVRDIFSKNGLPFNLTDRISLDNSGPVSALINFLEISENDFYYNNVFRALSGGFIDCEDINYANLLKVSSALKIVSGKNNWLNSINDGIANLKFKNEYDEELNIRTKVEYEKAYNDIITISKMLEPFDEKMTFPEFRTRLNDLIAKSKIPLNVLKYGQTGTNTAEIYIRGLTEFINTSFEIFELLEEEYGKDKKFDVGFFTDQLRTACGWARFNVKEKSNYGVQVTALEEIRGLQFDYLFIGGLCDGDFPTRFQPEIFFSGTYKKQAFAHQTEERNLFYQALCGWNKKLYLSYPLTEGGRETIVSTFLNDFENLFEIAKKNESDYSGKIYSNESLQISLGKYGREIIDEENNKNLDIEKIVKTINTEKERETFPFAGSAYSGNIVSGISAIDEKLNSYGSKQYSISQLEMYAKCPFKFFIERILGIEKIEEPSEDIEAREMGSVLHAILYRFYTKIRESKINIAGCDEKIFNKIKEIIYEIAGDELDLALFKSPLTFYEKEKILGIGGDSNESILNRFLVVERDNLTGFLPSFFEVNFGKLNDDGSDKILSTQEPVNAGGINLRGKIDRIEISENENAFNVIDYKLGGAKPSIAELKNGISLQLPVYLYAARSILSKKIGKEYTPNQMVIYSLKYNLEDFGRNAVSLSRKKGEEAAEVDLLIESTIEHIKNYVTQISSGKFGLSPHENRDQLICRYCQFKSVCRVENIAG